MRAARLRAARAAGAMRNRLTRKWKRAEPPNLRLLPTPRHAPSGRPYRRKCALSYRAGPITRREANATGRRTPSADYGRGAASGDCGAQVRRSSDIVWLHRWHSDQRIKVQGAGECPRQVLTARTRDRSLPSAATRPLIRRDHALGAAVRLPSLGHEPYDACLRRLGPSPCGRWPEGGASRTEVPEGTACPNTWSAGEHRQAKTRRGCRWGEERCDREAACRRRFRPRAPAGDRKGEAGVNAELGGTWSQPRWWCMRTRSCG